MTNTASPAGVPDDAKSNFGQLIGTARAEPVTFVKYGRQVVVVLAVEEYDRLKALDGPAADRKNYRVDQTNDS